MPPTPHIMASPLADAAEARMESLSGGSKPQQQDQPGQQAAKANDDNKSESDNYVSKIGILPSSLPYYHNQIMAQRKADKEAAARRAAGHDEGEEMTEAEAAEFAKCSLETGHKKVLSSAEQAANALRLKPHSRSTLQLQKINADAAERVETLSQTASKKRHGFKWQYGIRSRNQPLDAMHCIYKALKKQGAEWHVPNPNPNGENPEKGPFKVNVTGATHLSSADSNLSESPEKEKHAKAQRPYGQQEPSNQHYDGAGSSTERPPSAKQASTEYGNDDDVDPNYFPPGYLPDDPWVIHVRWRKDGMLPVGAPHPTSARSSRIDLSGDDAAAARRASVIGSMSSAAGSATSVATGTTGTAASQATESCYVYMDIQLYTMEPDTYLVDFKCAGYESIVRRSVEGAEDEFVGSGIRVADKDVTSPQPFLDLTNALVIQLAKG